MEDEVKMQEIRIKVAKEKGTVILIENYHVVEKYDINSQENIDGNIYMGVVKNIIPGINAAFVDIGKEKNAFIHFDDLSEYSKDIKVNSKILVQVQKNAIGEKGAKLTTKIKLTGRYIVLMPTVSFITTSRKIVDDTKKEELKELVKNNLHEKFGAIIRTSAEKASEEEIIEDIKRLEKRVEIIKNKIHNIDSLPCLIQEENEIIQSMILGTTEVTEIITNNNDLNKRILVYLEEYNLETKIKVVFDDKVFEKYTIQKELDDIEKNKVWLNCGGYIIMDKTEALTAIDVNSGKCIGKYDSEATILKVNEEASKEIARQIRLRDISGIIIIDFINMKSEEDKQKVLDIIKEEGKKDRSKIQIEGFTKLDLLEITRKNIY